MLGLPLMRESHFFVDGVIAIFARESFIEMERRRLCGEDFRIGEAAEEVEVSYGSELRKEGVSGERGVRGGNGLVWGAAVEEM
jgi:hypothetical protein